MPQTNIDRKISQNTTHSTAQKDCDQRIQRTAFQKRFQKFQHDSNQSRCNHVPKISPEKHRKRSGNNSINKNLHPQRICRSPVYLTQPWTDFRRFRPVFTDISRKLIQIFQSAKIIRHSTHAPCLRTDAKIAIHRCHNTGSNRKYIYPLCPICHTDTPYGIFYTTNLCTTDQKLFANCHCIVQILFCFLTPHSAFPPFSSFQTIFL